MRKLSIFYKKICMRETVVFDTLNRKELNAKEEDWKVGLVFVVRFRLGYYDYIF